MVFSAHLEFSKGSDPFEGKTFKRLPIKRRRDGLEYSANEDAEQEAVSEEDQSNYRLMCIIDGRDAPPIIIKKQCRFVVPISHKVYPLVFYPVWRHDLSLCRVKTTKHLGSYQLELEGKHAIEFCALITALDELSNVRLFNIAFDMIYRRFATETSMDETKNALYLLKFAYLVAFYKAGWNPGEIDISEFYNQKIDLINDIADGLLPNNHNFLELYKDQDYQAAECLNIYRVLLSIDLIKWDTLSESIILKGEHKKRHWPHELMRMIVKKVAQQTAMQQTIFKHLAREFNFRRLPSPAISLLPLRLLNSSFKASVDDVISKNFCIYRPFVGVGNCFKKQSLVNLRVSDAGVLQPTHSFCSPDVLEKIEHLLDSMSAQAYLDLNARPDLDEFPGLKATNKEETVNIEGEISRRVYTVLKRELLRN